MSDDEQESVGRGIRKIGEGIAFAALVACCAWMECAEVEGGAEKLRRNGE